MISYNNISLSFDHQVIFDDFSLEVNRGDKILISGKSGKGKSTLLKLLLGFQTYDSGCISLNGKPIHESNIHKWRQNFSYVNQDVTIRPGRVEDILSDIESFSGNDFSAHIGQELIDLFDFDKKLLHKKIEDLSGGERQRLGLMIAIKLDRPVILLDEVTSALDEGLKHRVVNYFAESDKTVIAVSHDSVWAEHEAFRKVAW